MKTVHLCTFEGKGGAAKAVLNLHKGLINIGLNDTLIVKKKVSNSTDIVGVDKFSTHFKNLKASIEYRFPRIFYKPQSLFSTSIFKSFEVLNCKEIIESDVICLTWINGNFISLKQVGELLSLNKPVFWRLSDMWPFTGGCHYSDMCENFINECGNCHIIKGNSPFDLSKIIYKTKKRYWDSSNLTIIAPSKWIGELAQKSSIFDKTKIEVINTGVDLSVYKPNVNNNDVKSKYSLPLNKNLICFGAISSTSDKRKGAKQLKEALKLYALKLKYEDLPHIIIFGNDDEAFDLHPYEQTNIGYINNENILSEIYSVSDVFIAPSLQENFPNTIIESFACGTGVIAFNVGGIPEIIDHKKNGYLVDAYDIKDFSNGIKWVLEKKNSHLIGKNALNKAQRCFDQKDSVKKYYKLYNKIKNSHN